MKTIYSTSDYPDALIKKGMLEQAGFLVYVENLNSAGGALPHLGYSEGYRIMVSDSDENVALELLSETVPGPGAHLPTPNTKSQGNQKPSKKLFAFVLIVIVLLVSAWAMEDLGFGMADDQPFDPSQGFY